MVAIPPPSLRAFHGLSYVDATASPTAGGGASGVMTQLAEHREDAGGAGGDASRVTGTVGDDGEADDDDEEDEDEDDEDGDGDEEDASGGAVFVQHVLRCYVPQPFAVASYGLTAPSTSGWSVAADGSRFLQGRLLIPQPPAAAVGAAGAVAGGVVGDAAAVASPPPPPPALLAFAHRFRRTISATNAITGRLAVELLAPPLVGPPMAGAPWGGASSHAASAACVAAQARAGQALTPAERAAWASCAFVEDTPLASSAAEALTATQLYGMR
jgi:hypothetical protein